MPANRGLGKAMNTKLRYAICVSAAWVLGVYAFLNGVVLIFFTKGPKDESDPFYIIMLLLNVPFWLRIILPGMLAGFIWSKRRK